MKQTNIERLKRYLLKGNDLTRGQAKTRFGVSNMTEATRELRLQGLAMYENPCTTANGKAIKLFRIGTSQRRVVAAGFQALGLV